MLFQLWALEGQTEITHNMKTIDRINIHKKKQTQHDIHSKRNNNH